MLREIARVRARRSSSRIATVAMSVTALLGACSSHDTFQQANLDASGQVRAVTSRGRVLQIPQDSGQAGVEQITMSSNKQAVGWLALYPTGGTTYPIPLSLTVLRPDARRTTIKGDLPIWQWAFTSNDRQVVLREAPLHGQMPTRYELRNARTGALVASIDVDADAARTLPSWARLVVTEPVKGR